MSETKKPRDWDKKRVEKSIRTQKEKTAFMDAQAEKVLKRQGKKLKYDSSKLFAYKLADYFYKCDHTVIDQERNKTEPYTLTGLSLALGLYGSSLCKYTKGEHNKNIAENTTLSDTGVYIEKNLQDITKTQLYDYNARPELIPYMEYLYDNTDLNAILYSNIYEKARLLVQQQAEQRLYINGRVADIFTMKSKHGWTDEVRTVHRLEIATDEQAKKALEDLRLLDD